MSRWLTVFRLVSILRNPALPAWVRILPLIAIVYMALPVDLIPDLPLIGWIDDLVVVLLAIGQVLRAEERLPQVSDYARRDPRAARG